LTVSAVAPGAQVHLAVAGEVGWVQDGGAGWRFRLLPVYVFPSRAVTIFTQNAQGDVCVGVAVGGRRRDSK
jgi:hypothetical protein